MDKYVLTWAIYDTDGSGLNCGLVFIDTLQVCRNEAKAMLRSEADETKPIEHEIDTLFEKEYYSATLDRGGELLLCIEKL